jgi:GTPase SAR1 family protein
MSCSKAKVIIVGDSGVGKSSIIGRLIDDTFMDRHLPTVGVEFHVKHSVLPNKR